MNLAESEEASEFSFDFVETKSVAGTHALDVYSHLSRFARQLETDKN